LHIGVGDIGGWLGTGGGKTINAYFHIFYL
jgi:hypothetical protein